MDTHTRALDPSVTPQSSEGESRAPAAVQVASDASLTEAQGVSPLRHTIAGKRESSQTSTRSRALFIAGVILVSCAVLVGGYMIFRGAFQSLDQVSATAPSRATDAYTIWVTEDAEGNLARVSLWYVDSINGRAEQCVLGPDVYYTNDGSHVLTLAAVYDDRGLSGLCDAVGALAGIPIKNALVLTEDESNRILTDVVLAGSTDAARNLAHAVWDDNQDIRSSALEKLLVTMAQIGPEGYVELTAPCDASEATDGTMVCVLRGAEWSTMVRGMRDPSGDVLW